MKSFNSQVTINNSKMSSITLFDKAMYLIYRVQVIENQVISILVVAVYDSNRYSCAMKSHCNAIMIIKISIVVSITLILTLVLMYSYGTEYSIPSKICDN